MHIFSMAHPYMQTSANFNNLVIYIIILYRIFYGVQLFMKLLFCYLEHLDLLRLGHAK